MNYFDYFKQYCTELKPGILQQNVICPFHDDTQASMSVNVEKGKYYCHGCNAHGDIFSWVMHWEKCSFKAAKIRVLGETKADILSIAEVREAHNFLLKKTYLHDLLLKHRGWTLETILKFKLGYNDSEKRVTIPIFDENNQLKNIRKYLIVGKPTKQNPKFRGVRGHNEGYFFPIKNLVTDDKILSKFICIFAGEPDTILACQWGINAGTFTSGEGGFNRNLLPHFKNKITYICYDVDLAGVRGSKNVGLALHDYAKEVRIIQLPFG